VGKALAARLLLTVPILFGTTLIVFAIIRLVPGDPAVAVLGFNASPRLVAALHHQLHLDLPVWRQYLLWLGGLIRGDWGIDYRNDKPISDLLLTALPVTTELVLLAILFAIVVGIPLGILAAIRRRRTAERVCLGFSMAGLSIPDFWLGIMLILLFSLWLGIFPSSGYVSIRDDPGENLLHMALPAITLGTALAAAQIRITRTAMLDVLQQDFVRFVRAKGVREGAVIVKHALRNAAIPIVTVLGLQAGYLFGGTIVVEQVFALPGLGRLLLNSVLTNNYPTVQASILVLALMFILANLLVDLMYIVLDPRLRVRNN
jgi:peptide/nickel transport system permease protein